MAKRHEISHNNPKFRNTNRNTKRIKTLLKISVLVENVNTRYMVEPACSCMDIHH